MGGYNSIEELKNDENIRNLIKESINSIYDMQNEYHENVKEVTKIDVDSDVIGTNEVNSGGGVMIGSGNDGINISQSTNLQTEMQTMYYGNFLSKNDEPIVQLVSSDLLNITQKDNSENEMPNFYDPIYIMTLLGFNVKYAEFDFENDRIKYIIDYGSAKNQIDEQTVQEYEKMNDEQNEHKNHNEKYKVKRKYLLDIQDKLNETNEKYNGLLDEGKGSVKGSDLTAIRGKISIAQQNVNKDMIDLQNNKAVKEKQEEKYGSSNIPLDSKVKEKLNIVLNNEIFKENVESIKAQYIEEAKKSGVSEKDASEQLTDNTIISLFNSALLQSKDSIISIYGEDAVNDFSNSIINYLTSYNNYMQTVFLVIIKECLNGYSEDASNEVKELKTLDDKYRSDINTLNELNINYQSLSEQFNKENPNITEELFELGNEIKRLTAELTSNESAIALKYYEYYDTEHITKELISKIDKDIDQKSDLMNQYDTTDPSFKTLKDDSTKLFNSYIFSTQDADYDMVQIQNNKAYQNNIEKLTSGLKEENEKMKNIKSQITISEEYKKAYNEYTKDMYDVQKEYVTISEVINYSKNQKLIDLYLEYTKEREKYYNSITLKTIVNYSNKDNNEEDVKKLKELFYKYNKDTDLAKKYKKEYEEVQDQIKQMDKYNEYVEISSIWQNLRTTKIKFENMLEAYENSISADYQYMSFEKLYDTLVSGYTANMNEKILNIKDKVKNIETNITRSTYNYAQNKISINGNLQDANLSQNNAAIQKMYDGFERIITEADKLIENEQNNSSLNNNNNNDDEVNDDITKDINLNNNNRFFNKNIILLLIILTAVCLLFLAAVIYYKRKVNIASMAYMTDNAS